MKQLPPTPVSTYLAFYRQMASEVDAAAAPCGLRGCKNGPAPFPGRMSYKATNRDVVLGTCTCTRVQLEYRFQVLVLEG